MATNLRLRPDAAEAVRLEAERTGTSQQDVIRAAVDSHLGLVSVGGVTDLANDLVRELRLCPPRTPFRTVVNRVPLPDNVTVSDLLDRSDRL
jgi:hypothetical protein